MLPELAVWRSQRVLGQVFRFGVTGVAATALHGLVYLLATGPMHLGPFTGNALGYAVALPLAFAAHFFWTFRDQARGSGRSGVAVTAMRFVAINAIGFSLNGAIIWMVTIRFGWAAAAAVPFMATLTPAVTFLLSRYWGFRHSR